jgi:hypothetical protein
VLQVETPIERLTWGKACLYKSTGGKLRKKYQGLIWFERE